MNLIKNCKEHGFYFFKSECEKCKVQDKIKELINTRATTLSSWKSINTKTPNKRRDDGESLASFVSPPIDWGSIGDSSNYDSGSSNDSSSSSSDSSSDFGGFGGGDFGGGGASSDY